MLSKLSLATGLVLLFSSFASASTAIGTAIAPGDIRVDGYVVKGNATLFDGTGLETARATATVRMSDGTEIKLAPDSQGTLFRDHLVLRRGRIELAASDTFVLEASGLRVTSSGSRARGLIAMSGHDSVQVTAVTGALEVFDGNGLLLAHVDPGAAESFTPQPQSSGTVTIVGRLIKSGGRFFIKQKDGTIIQALGVNLDQYVGKELTFTGTILTGATPTGGATTVISVVKVSQGAKRGGGSGLAHAPLLWIVGGAAAVTAITVIVESNNGASR